MIDGIFVFFLQIPLFSRKLAYFCLDKLKYHYMRAYKSHFNLQGHHPKVRPWNRHADYGVSIKVARLLSPKVMLLCASEEKLLETMVVEMGCSDSGMWYVDTAGCAMLQANDAEPPPQRGWLHKAMQSAAVFLLGLMLLAGPTSCKKDPQPSPTPTPNTPTDTVTPVIPGDTITPVNPGDTIPDVPGDTLAPWPGGDTIVPGPGGDTIVPVPGGKVVNFYYDGGVELPPLDSIRKYADDPEYDTIYIRWCVVTQNYWTPGGFHSARDSLNKRFNISPKVYGGWWVIPYQILPDADSTNIGVKGMIQSDKDWYESKHYIVMPIIGGKNAKKPQQPPRYNGTMALPRNNCRGGRVRGR